MPLAKVPKRNRAWCYTINNFTQEEVGRLSALVAMRHVCAEEVGESGTKHLQGYIRFEQPCNISWWKNQFPRAHVEIRRGTEEQAVQYCMKDGNVIIDIGETLQRTGVKRGREETTMEVIDMINEGATMRAIYLSHPVFYFYNHRNIATIKKHVEHWKQDPDTIPFNHNE